MGLPNSHIFACSNPLFVCVVQNNSGDEQTSQGEQDRQAATEEEQELFFVLANFRF